MLSVLQDSTKPITATHFAIVICQTISLKRPSTSKMGSRSITNKVKGRERNKQTRAFSPSYGCRQRWLRPNRSASMLGSRWAAVKPAARRSRRHFAPGGLSPTAHITFRDRQESKATYVRLKRGERADTQTIVGLSVYRTVLRSLWRRCHRP